MQVAQETPPPPHASAVFPGWHRLCASQQPKGQLSTLQLPFVDIPLPALLLVLPLLPLLPLAVALAVAPPLPPGPCPPEP